MFPVKVEVDPGLVEPAAYPTVGRLADTSTTVNSRLAAATGERPAGRRGDAFFWFVFHFQTSTGGPPCFFFLAPRAEVAP